MNDIAFVAIILAFFFVAVLFVEACERIIGVDNEAAPGATPDEAAPEEVAA